MALQLQLKSLVVRELKILVSMKNNNKAIIVKDYLQNKQNADIVIKSTTNWYIIIKISIIKLVCEYEKKNNNYHKRS